MRLADLEPEWVTKNGREVGVKFSCPHCQRMTLAVLFANPMDGATAHPPDASCVGDNGGKRWTRTGETFADLSLTPSVDAAGHWHGVVTAGAIITC